MQINEENEANGHTSSTKSEIKNDDNVSSDGSVSDSDAENDKGALCMYHILYFVCSVNIIV